MRQFHPLIIKDIERETRDSIRIALAVPAELHSEYEFLLSLLRTERAVGKYTLLGTHEEGEDFSKRFEVYFRERSK